MSDVVYTIRGYYFRMLHRDEKTGYSLFAVKADRADEYTNKYGCYTVNGYIPMYDKLTPLEIVGKWRTDKMGGKILAANSIKEVSFSNYGTMKYLEELQCGLTHNEAYEIMRALRGKDLFEEVMNGNRFFLDVASAGVDMNKLTSVWKRIVVKTNVLAIYNMLKEYSVLIPDIERISSCTLMSDLKMHPYRYLMRMGHISFEEADKIVQCKLGIKTSVNEKIMAFMSDTVAKCESSGSIWIDFKDFMQKSKKMFPDSYSDADKSSLILDEISGLGNIVSVRDKQGVCRIVSHGMYLAECNSARLIKNMLKNSKSLLSDTQISEAIEKNQKELKISYAPAQKESFKLLKRTGVAVLTGGPGVGKTTVINGLLKAYESAFPMNKVCLAAPTGRAAQRMAESTKHEAQTIHRLLGIGGSSGVYKAKKSLDADLIVIDESSMIDSTIMSILLDAIKCDALLLLVGDVDQLPSVGAGDVLHDCIKCGKIPVCKLETVFRQGNESLIVKNANAVNSGNSKLLEDDLFMITHCNDDTEIGKAVLGHAMEWWDPNNPFSMQVLCPAHEGPGGDRALNKLLQEQFNPKQSGKKEVKFGSVTFRENDKVMFTSNNYNTGYLNGDLGIIKKINDGNMIIDLNGEDLTIERNLYPDLTLAYSISIHKSQGSEFSNLILVMPNEPAGMLKRNLLYTGITRAKASCIIVAGQKTIEKATDTVETGKRRTLLGDLLAG